MTRFPADRMSRMGAAVRPLALPLCLAAVFGCAPDPEQPAVATVTYSAGVRIVEHRLAPAPIEWIAAVDDGLVLQEDPAAPMFNVRTALKLPDGRYAVADGGNVRISFFSAAGALESSTGRLGEGPGEFANLSLLGRGVADSLVVWDRQQRRISVLTLAGDFVRSFALETTEEVVFANVVGGYADGSFLATGFVDTGGAGPANGLHAYTSPSYHFGAAGRLLAHSGILATSETWYDVDDGGFRVYPPLFGTQSFRTPSGNRLVTATSERYEVRLRARDGTPSTIIRREPRARPVTSEARRSLTEQLVGEARAEVQEEFRRVLDGMEVPDLLPEISDLFGDPRGRVWIREYEVPEPESIEWRIYDADGLLLASVALPARFEPTDAGEDFVLGILTDALDVESVVEYPLLR